MRCAIYARVSTKRDAQKHSLENQIAYVTDIISRNGWTIAGHYVDDGISGATISKRDEMQRLIADAKKKKFDVVIAKSVSRLGRNSIENMRTASDIEGMGIRLILPEDNHDTATSTSRFNFNLRAILAEEDSAKYAWRIKLGRQGSARLGKYQASLPAFGYKRDDAGKLILDEDFAPIVRKIFDLYLYEGWGMYKISNYLIKQGVPTPRTVSGASNAGTLWHQSSIKLILKNIVYTGTLAQHREEIIDFITKKRKAIEQKEQIIFQNAHAAIINNEEYQIAQDMMRKKGLNKSNGQESLFAHIAVCPDCGKGMVYRKDRGKNGAYVCGGYVKHGKAFCSSHLISSNYLLDTVKNDLKEFIASNVKVDALCDEVKGKISLHQSAQLKELQKVSKRLTQHSRDFQDLFQLYTQKAISIEQFTIQNQHMQEEQSKLANRKTELETLNEIKKDTENQFRALRKEIEKFANMQIDDESILKQLLQRVIHKVEIHKDGDIKIHYNIARPQILGAIGEGA